jgi:hypothetical protein
MLKPCIAPGSRRRLFHQIGLLAGLAMAAGCGAAEEGSVQLPPTTRDRLAPQVGAPAGKRGAPGETKPLSIKDPKNRAPVAPPDTAPAK